MHVITKLVSFLLFALLCIVKTFFEYVLSYNNKSKIYIYTILLMHLEFALINIKMKC